MIGRVIEDDNLLHGGTLADDGPDLRQLVGRNQDPLRVGMVDAEKQVTALAEVDRERNVDGAGVEGAQFRQDPHRAALREQRDLFAFLQAERHQARADAVSFPARLLLGDFLPDAVHLLAEIDASGKLPGVLFNEIDDGWSFVVHKAWFLFSFNPQI